MSEHDLDPAPSPSAVMLQMLSGFQVSQALYVVAERGVATILEQEGPKDLGELARRTDTDPDALARLIRTLAPLGVFRTTGHEVGITPIGATLSEKHPQSVNAAARMWMETHYLPFSELNFAVRTGRPGADQFFGEPFFDWLSRDPDRVTTFSHAMADVTRSLRTGMFDDYALPPGRVVADIGGADGSVLVELLRHDGDPDRRGIVFDLPGTVTSAGATIAAAGLSDRVELVGGDFFSSVPAADIYILGWILHDWDDASSRRILSAIAAAASPGARLLLVEGIVPGGDVPHLTKAVDLTMLGMLTGRERTEVEYRHLLAGAGITIDRVVATTSPFAILEATVDAP